MSSDKMIKVLFIGTLEASERIYGSKMDFELLSKHFDTKIINPINARILKNLPSLSLEIFKNVQWADISFSWFIDEVVCYTTLLARLCGKKSVVIPSGYCVANIPEIEYGLMRKTKERKGVQLTLKLANKILAVSKYNQQEISRYTNNPNIELIYHGVDSNRFMPGPEAKENLVVTVGIVKSSNLKRKGLETFVKAAFYLPDVNFLLIGKHEDKSIDYLKSIATSNVKFTGFVSNSKLLKYMQKAKVYVQVSIHEAFGLSLAEAMLCECVPVVTRRAAIPELVEDSGFYVPYGDPKATAEGIKKGLKASKGKKAMERVKSMFSIEKREKKIIQIINSSILSSK